MEPSQDQTRDPWICSQTRICCQARYRLRYAARYLYISRYEAGYISDNNQWIKILPFWTARCTKIGHIVPSSTATTLRWLHFSNTENLRSFPIRLVELRLVASHSQNWGSLTLCIHLIQVYLTIIVPRFLKKGGYIVIVSHPSVIRHLLVTRSRLSYFN